jgi:hypothetical protein
MLRIRFDIEITEDHHRIQKGKKHLPSLLSELSDEVSGAVSGHEEIEGNAVTCTGVDVLIGTK